MNLNFIREINFGTVKPSFIISGVQKGGTTSLHDYLIQHPRLIAPVEKELHFFDTLNSTPRKTYLDFFPRRYFTNEISFEATPRYLYYPGTAKKIFDYNHKLKFIVLIRDPVKRAFSAWNMYQQMSKVKSWVLFFKKVELKSPKEQLYTFFCKNGVPAFEDWMDLEINSKFSDGFIEPSLLRRGYYSNQIECYFEYFAKEQFLFIDSEKLKNNTLEVLNEIAEFLKIKDFNGLKLDISIKHKRIYETKLPKELYLKYLLHYQSKNKNLEELTALQFDWMKPIN